MCRNIRRALKTAFIVMAFSEFSKFQEDWEPQGISVCLDLRASAVKLEDHWHKVLSREEFYFLANRDRTFVKGDDHVMNNKSGMVYSVLNPAQWR